MTLVENSRTQKSVIFLHIPKTAGTTLHRIIERHCRPEHLYSVGFTEDESVAALRGLSDARKARIRVLRGHFGFGVHRFIPEPSTYFTLLRDPVDRVISYYYFIRRSPNHYLHDHIASADLSLREFVESRRHVMTNNAQTRFLSGAWLGPFFGDKFGECTRDMLVLAKRNLRDNFAVVGLVEKFDETLLLLKRAFGWRNIFYTRQNVTVDRPRREELSPETLRLIVAANQLDIELYQYGSALFQKQVRGKGRSFTWELKLFRIANRRLLLLLARRQQIGRAFESVRNR